MPIARIICLCMKWSKLSKGKSRTYALNNNTSDCWICSYVHVMNTTKHTHRRWLQPMIEMTFRATRLCKLQCSTASAIIRPPINMSIVSFMYIMAVRSVLWSNGTHETLLWLIRQSVFQDGRRRLTRMPNVGNRTIGSNDVIGSGSASVTQKMVISRTTYMHRYS